MIIALTAIPIFLTPKHNITPNILLKNFSTNTLFFNVW